MKKLSALLWLAYACSIGAMESAMPYIPENATPEEILKICIEQALKNDFWQQLHVQSAGDIPLNEVVGIMPHNAYANPEAGYMYSQQPSTLEEQFDSGAMGAMLDFHEHTTKSNSTHLKPGELVLAHTDSPGDNMQVKWGPFHVTYGKSQSVVDAFKKQAACLKKYQDRVFFEDIEDDVSGSNTVYKKRLHKLIKQSGLAPFVVRPQDLHNFFIQNPHKTFPSRNDLGTRRLFIGDDTRSGKWFFHAWKSLFKENNFSTLDFDEITQERSSSKKAGGDNRRKLYLMNFFPRGDVYEVKGPRFVKKIAATTMKVAEHVPHFGKKLKKEEVSTHSLNDINDKLLPDALWHVFTTEGSMFYHRLPNLLAIDGYKKSSFPSAFCNVVNSLPDKQRKKLFGLTQE